MSYNSVKVVSNIKISHAVIADLPMLADLSCRTFSESFASQNKPADIEKYLSENFNSNKLREELSDSSSHFFIATLNGKPAGYMKLGIRGLPVESAVDNAIEIERIYVDKQFQSLKVGSRLMQLAVDFAKSNGFKSILLGVWENNLKAISFYKNQGFEIYGSHIFMLGDDPQRDFLMVSGVGGV